MAPLYNFTGARVLGQLAAAAPGAFLAHVSKLTETFKSTSSLADLENALSTTVGLHLQFQNHNQELLKCLRLEGYLMGHCFVRSKNIDDLVTLLTLGIKYSAQQLGNVSEHDVSRQSYLKTYQTLVTYVGRLFQIEPTSLAHKTAIFDWINLVASEFKRHLDEEFLTALVKTTELSTHLEVLFEIAADNPEDGQRLTQEYADEVAQFASALPGVKTSNCRIRLFDNDIRWRQSGGKKAIRGLSDVMRLVRQGCISAQAGTEKISSFVYALGDMSELCEKIYAINGSVECFTRAEGIFEVAILSIDSIVRNRSSRMAVDTASKDMHSDVKAYAHASMASLLRRRHMETGSQEAANEACRHAERAVTLSKGGNDSHKMMLGLCLKAQYKVSGDASALSKAIETLRDINIYTSQHKLQATLANELGLMLRLRSIRTDSAEDLDDAITMMRAVVELSVPGLLLDGSIYNNLALCLQLRYSRTKNVEDNREARSYLEAALKNLKRANTANPVAQYGIIANLANCYSEEFKHSQRQEDVDKAIEHSEKAMRLMPGAGVQRFAVASDFSTTLEQKYQLTKDPKDLDRAVEQARSSFDLIPDNHVQRCTVIRHLTRLLRTQATLSDELADTNLSECLALQFEGFGDEHGMPLDRIAIGCQLAQDLSRAGMPLECRDTLSEVLDLFAHIEPQSSNDANRDSVVEALKKVGDEITKESSKDGLDADEAHQVAKLVEKYKSIHQELTRVEAVDDEGPRTHSETV